MHVLQYRYHYRYGTRLLYIPCFGCARRAKHVARDRSVLENPYAWCHPAAYQYCNTSRASRGLTRAPRDVHHVICTSTVYSSMDPGAHTYIHPRAFTESVYSTSPEYTCTWYCVLLQNRYLLRVGTREQVHVYSVLRLHCICVCVLCPSRHVPVCR